MREAVHEMLLSLNGLARLRLNARRPLSVANLQRVEEDGKKHYYLLAESATLSIRGTASILKIGESGTTEPIQQEDALPLWFSLAETDQIVARVLRMYGKAAYIWKDLYPIYEIIESDVGGNTALVSKGWTSGNQIKRFTRTANHSEAGGEDARHGISAVEPPPNPMTPAEGKDFISSLLTQWLAFKQSQRIL